MAKSYHGPDLTRLAYAAYEAIRRDIEKRAELSGSSPDPGTGGGHEEHTGGSQ